MILKFKPEKRINKCKLQSMNRILISRCSGSSPKQDPLDPQESQHKSTP